MKGNNRAARAATDVHDGFVALRKAGRYAGDDVRALTLRGSMLL